VLLLLLLLLLRLRTLLWLRTLRLRLSARLLLLLWRTRLRLWPFDWTTHAFASRLRLRRWTCFTRGLYRPLLRLLPLHRARRFPHRSRTLFASRLRRTLLTRRLHVALFACGL